MHNSWIAWLAGLVCMVIVCFSFIFGPTPKQHGQVMCVLEDPSKCVILDVDDSGERTTTFGEKMFTSGFEVMRHEHFVFHYEGKFVCTTEHVVTENERNHCEVIKP